MRFIRNAFNWNPWENLYHRRRTRVFYYRGMWGYQDFNINETLGSRSSSSSGGSSRIFSRKY